MPFPFPVDEPSTRLGFSQNPLDRMSDRRMDADWLAGVIRHPDARFVVYAGDKVAILRDTADDDKGTIFLPLETVRKLGVDLDETVLLGLDGDLPAPAHRQDTARRPGRFAALSDLDPDTVIARGLDVIDLRSLVLTAAVPASEAGAAAQGRSLFNWHLSHRFCAKCGASSRMTQAGYRRDCPACGAQHFPRTDPVVIMAIIDGDQVLLGRQARFVPGMYSCLAGFLEPGETIEDAVRRETWEEAGIHVGRVAYHSSQPWPFPASLMIGCIGEALTRDIVPDHSELEDCRWFSRAEAAQMLSGTHPDEITSPKPIAIAHHLLKAFIDTA